MRRIDIIYGAATYHVVDRSIDELKREIADGFTAGQAWLTVRDGGAADVFLHLSPGTPIVVQPIVNADLDAPPDHSGVPDDSQ